MITYIAAAWLVSCMHLDAGDPLNPAPEHGLKYIRFCVPIPAGTGIKYLGACVENPTDAMGYASLVPFPDNIDVEISAGLKPCATPTS